MGRWTENERNQIVFIELPQICLFLRTLITGVIIIMFASVWDVCRRDGGSVICKRYPQSTSRSKFKLWEQEKFCRRNCSWPFCFPQDLGYSTWATWDASNKTGKDKLKPCPPEWYWQAKRLVSKPWFSTQNNQRPDKVSVNTAILDPSDTTSAAL